MLIDRNDELAVLHEKAHLQEAQIAAGNLDMGLRENEVRCWGSSLVQQGAVNEINGLGRSLHDLGAGFDKHALGQHLGNRAARCQRQRLQLLVVGMLYVAVYPRVCVPQQPQATLQGLMSLELCC